MTFGEDFQEDYLSCGGLLWLACIVTCLFLGAIIMAGVMQ